MGRRTAAQHQRSLSFLLVLFLLVLAGMVFWTILQTQQRAAQVAAVGQALVQSQHLARSVTQALTGNEGAFAEVRDSASTMFSDIRGLQLGNSAVSALGEAYLGDMGKIAPMVDAARKNSDVILAEQKTLTEVGGSLQALSRQSAELSEAVEAIMQQRLVQQGASAAELSSMGMLAMLAQRIGKSASEFLTAQGVSMDAAFLLRKDLDVFGETAQGLLDGDSDLGRPGIKDAQVRAQLESLLTLFGETRKQSEIVLTGLRGLASAREAQSAIVADSEPLRQALEQLQDKLGASRGVGAVNILGLVLPALFAFLCAAGLMVVQLRESRAREQVAEAQRQEAEHRQMEVKRVNDANQAAILRLMNELQTVAEGDLTQEATVTEDITGAIADSVNYTVEELRSLVGSVQSTATRVAQTTSKVETASAELLTVATEQLREIRETGQSVLDMAGRINAVSVQAQKSAAVARQSRQAAESGLTAVQNSIGGMNTIRDQIQETSKRIKRLGESSQEIGEITELIADITEQTNVLALNAAIQAASAGEAGRGFSVVAEEVQRLAERSGDATRQIAALVKAIQTDTQDAVAAMERSTQGVVEGARLSDNAGTALSEIDRVSRSLAELIEQISASALQEAEQANGVAGNIQHIFDVTEQTVEGTRTTASQVRDLAAMADELRQSVARFKIA
ncbi:MAG: methyl-accepting chemotaxis protein [Burkholderiaceae bacterium]|nr:methyl-accepting chemotaxis protein [Burkholderiaceae bacterium]